MYLAHEYINETAYCVRPSVVKSGEISTVRIYAADTMQPLRDSDIYELRILAKDCDENYCSEMFSVFGKEKCASVCEVSPVGGVISITHQFYGFQEWIIYLRKKDDDKTEWWWCDSFPKTRARLSIYCVPEDIFGSIPMKGDFHIHTTLSDGSQTPEFHVAAYRAAGFDLIAITDHYKYNDARALTEYFSFASPLYILPGEEVHNATALIHMVSLGADHQISDLLKSDPEVLAAHIARAREKYPVPEELYEEEYLLNAVIYDEIKAGGGYAILPHPFWQLPEHYHVQPAMSRAVLENGLCDALEVFGGTSPEGNDLQLSFYHSLSRKNLPVVASSDSHTVLGGCSAFDELYSICFYNKGNSVINSVFDGKTVAVYAPKGEDVRTCGKFEYVKYVHFLLRCYFPKHNLLCKKSGELLKKYVEGDVSLKEEIIAAERDVRKFTKEFFGL